MKKMLRKVADRFGPLWVHRVRLVRLTKNDAVVEYEHEDLVHVSKVEGTDDVVMVTVWESTHPDAMPAWAGLVDVKAREGGPVRVAQIGGGAA